MRDAIAAELLKLRTVRSTYGLLIAVGLLMAGGWAVVLGMALDFDDSPPELRARFGVGEARVLVIPFAEFCLAALGALMITSEFGTGMIRPSLAAVPDRRTMVVAKAAAVGAVALVVGQVVAFGTFFGSWLIAGDRPAPLWPWPSVSDALGEVAASGLSVAVLGLVGLGVGLLVRSTAGALVTLAVLLFVLPTIATFLPSPWEERVAAVLPQALAPQLSGAAEPALLSPLGASAAMLAYVLLALGAGTAALLRRDA